MASKTPEIQADALLNLVLDEKQLKAQLKNALGTSIAEAAKNANLGDQLLSPKNLQQMRRNLQKQFQEAGKDIANGLNLAQSDSLKGVLDRTRRDTVKKFERDINDLLAGKGRSATRSLPALPQLGKEMQEELRAAMRVFGKDSLRSGSYQQRAPELMQAQRSVAELNKIFTELAGIPAVAAKDLQKIRSLVNDKDTGRYLQMQKTERANLAKSSQALSLQTQTLNRLAGSLSKMGFGDLATDIKTANQARKDLVSSFNKLSSPASVEQRAQQEARVQQRADQQQAQRDRRALQQEIKQREAMQRASGQAPARYRDVPLGLRSTMDDETRARLGYPSRTESRAASLATLQKERAPLNDWFAQANAADRKLNPLEQIQQNISRAQAASVARNATRSESDLTAYNDAIRKNGDQMLALRAKAQAQTEASLTAYNEGIRKNGDQMLALRAKSMQQAEANLTAYNEGIRKNGDQMLALRAKALENERRSQQGGGNRRTGGGGGGGGRGDSEYSAAGNLLGTFSRYALGYGGLYQVLNAVTKLKDEIIELDRAFYSIKAVTQATDVEMQSISRSIKEVALNTNFTTREIAGAAEILGQAGVAPAEMDKVLGATAKFASATNSSLSVAADLMTTVRTVFKELSDNVIADQLTRAVNLSKLTVEDLQTILSLSSQTAKSYNINLEQLLAATTTLRNAGIKPSTVATGLRQAMLEVFNPDTATMKALQTRYAQMQEKVAGQPISNEQISQRFFGFTNAQNPLLAALTELRRIGFTDEGQKVLQRGVDIRAFNAIQGLLQNFKELQEAESNITFGQAAAEGAEIQMKSLAATLENLTSSVTVLAEQMSEGLVRSLANGATEATNLIEKLTELDLQMKATGEGSLNQILGGAAAGGLAGVAAGKGFRGKLVGGLAGAVGGGYLAGGGDAAEELGIGNEAKLAAAVATIMAVVTALGWIGKFAGSLGKVSSGLGAAGAGAGMIAAGGSKLLPVIGWISTAVTVIGLLADLVPDDAEAQAEKVRAQAALAGNQAAKARAALSENVDTVAAFDPNAANPKEGTASAAFSKYRDQVDNFNIALEQAFGEAAAGKSKELGDALKTYAAGTYSQRTATDNTSRAAIEKAIGKPLDTGEVTDKILFDLGVQREEIDATVSAFVDNTRQLINGVTERIRAAREAGQEISKRDQAMSDAFSADAANLQSIIDGTSTDSPEQMQETLEAFYQSFVDAFNNQPQLAAEARQKNMAALADQLAAQLANTDNSAEIAATVSQIANSLEYISLSAEDRLKSVLNGIQGRIAQIDKAIAEEEGNAPGPISRFASWVKEQRGTPDPQAEAAEAARQANLARLRQQRQDLLNEEDRQRAQEEARQKKLASDNEAARQSSGQRAADLISMVNDQNPQGIGANLRKALGDTSILQAMQIQPKDIQYLQQVGPSLLSGDADLFGRLASTQVDKTGKVQMSDEFNRLSGLLAKVADNVDRVTKAQERQARDEQNLVTPEMSRARGEAKNAITRAEQVKNYSLLSSDSPDNPVVQFYDAQRAILEKEVAQAKAKMDDAKGTKRETAAVQAYYDAQDKLNELADQRATKLSGYAAKLKTQGERQKKKDDAEAKRQARIDVTQTGIEQRTVKQDFDEAVRTGDTQAFLDLSKKYEEVQAKLRDQLETELKARGYNTEQILAEIKLRQDLNKPLAEQVENIRKLATQRTQMRNLNYRDVGTGPDLGGKYNTAYLGADGFTTEEQMAAAVRDITLLQKRMAEVRADQANPLFAKDAETTEKLNKEMENLQSQLGSTQATLDKMSRGGADSIYAAFSPRNLVIELERSQNTFERLGDNLRSTLGSAINDIGQGLATAINNGEKFSDVLQNIINQAATQALGDLFSTNINEGVKGLIKGYQGDEKTGQGGGLGGIWDSITGGFSNFFGFGGDKAKGASAGGASGDTGGFLSSLFGLGMQGGAAGTMQSVGTMTVTAGSVTVIGGSGGLGVPGADGGAAAAGQGVLSSGTPAGVGSAASATGGSWMGALGGAGMGMGIGAALGGAIGGKKGSKWGAILGGLAGAYFGFGMASGGHITKSGLVMGSGPRGVDSVPVRVPRTGKMGMLAPGEGVLNTNAMDALGSDWLNAANSGKLFRRAVGGVIDQSYNASQRAEAAAARSVAQSSDSGGGNGPVVVNLKNVNVTDPSQVYNAMQKREGEDLMINRLQARGALNNARG